MLRQYSKITDFIKCKEKCFFCDSSLKCRLTNYFGLDDVIPVINAPLKNGLFSFHLAHTTSNYDIKGDVTVDADKNTIVFAPRESEMPRADELVMMDILGDLHPHIELYCPKKKCPQQYAVSSRKFLFSEGKYSSWVIFPLEMYSETFIEGRLWVMNNYVKNETYIYSRAKESADPLVVPLLDFEAMGRKKLLTRVKTLVTFS